MKLYTEEQVRVAMSLSFLKDYEIASTKKIIESLKSIELPSDEEMRKESLEFYDNNGADFYFIQGAKWVIEQIKQQDDTRR